MSTRQATISGASSRRKRRRQATPLPRWGGLGDALPILRNVSEFVASGAPVPELITRCLQTITHTAGGRETALLVSEEEMWGVLGEDPGEASEIELNDGAILVIEGALATAIVDWEGASKPVLLDHGTRLVLPLERGGAVVVDPESGIALDEDRLNTMRVLLDLTSGLVAVAGQITHMRRRSRELEETRRRLREQTMLLTELSVVDELTGLYNRRYFERRLSFEIERFQRYGHRLSFALLDVDFFKKVNDTYGHPVGDVVLKWLAEVGGETIRNLDLLARFGGEEFALLMPDTDMEGAMVAVNRVIQNIRDTPCVVGDLNLDITVSIGVATATKGWTGDAESLVRMADQALYRAKETGRDRVVAAQPPSAHLAEEPDTEELEAACP